MLRYSPQENSEVTEKRCESAGVGGYSFNFIRLLFYRWWNIVFRSFL